MCEKILLVDDDANILSAFRRQLRKKFELKTAEGASAAMELLDSDGPFAVIVSDMQMPEITGLELLAHAREQFPDTVRIMLTGNADQRTAVDAANQGRIFRFLNKPCSPDDLALALEAGLEQYRLVTAERKLLSETLNGSIELLNDVLGITNPIAFGRANRLRNMTKLLQGEVSPSSQWQLSVAAGLSQIGWVTIPNEVVDKYDRQQPLSDSERAMVEEIPRHSAKFVSRIPGLEVISQIIELQPLLAETADIESLEPEVVECAKLLDLTLTYNSFSEKLSSTEALNSVAQIDRFREQKELLNKLEVAVNDTSEVICINLDKLRENMILEQDMTTTDGMLVVPDGQVITESLILRLKNYDANQGILQPFKVRVQ